MDDIQKRMEWYSSTYDIEKCKQETFNFQDLYIKLLEQIENKNNDFFISYLKKECKCKSLDNCNCDTEESFDVSSVKIDLHSNCKSSININIKKKIKSNCRLFFLTKEDKEFRFIDIYKKYIVIYNGDKQIKFTNENLHFYDSTLYIRYDYMSFY